MHAPAAEPGLRNGEGAALFAEQMVGRYTDAGIANVTFRSLFLTVHADIANDFDTRRIDRHDEHAHPLVPRRIGVGDRHNDQKIGPFAVGGKPFLPVDDPVLTVPSGGRDETGRVRTALRLGHRKGRNYFVIEQGRKIPRFLFGRSVMGDDFGISGIGRLTAKHDRRETRTSEDLVHEPELYLSVSLTAEFRSEMTGPETFLLHFLLKRTDEFVPARVLDVVRMNAEQTERLDLFADERLHPVELFLKFGVRFEIPSHAALSVSFATSVRLEEHTYFSISHKARDAPVCIHPSCALS